MEKIQKIRSLNKAIYFPSPSVSFSYPKQQHQGSQSDSFIPKSKQNVIEGATIGTTIGMTVGTNVGLKTMMTRRLLGLSYLILERMTIGMTIGTMPNASISKSNPKNSLMTLVKTYIETGMPWRLSMTIVVTIGTTYWTTIGLKITTTRRLGLNRVNNKNSNNKIQNSVQNIQNYEEKKKVF